MSKDAYDYFLDAKLWIQKHKVSKEIQERMVPIVEAMPKSEFKKGAEAVLRKAYTLVLQKEEND